MTVAAAIRREYVFLSHILRTLWMLRHVRATSSCTIVDIVEEQARRRPHAPALIHQDGELGYAEMNARADAYACWAIAQGIGQGDCVALLMENRPDYVCAWLGLFKAGAQAALINTNLMGQALAHSISLCGARHIIVGSELASQIAAAPFVDAPRLWAQGGAVPGMDDLDAVLAGVAGQVPSRTARAGVRQKDRAFFIYTSGTTGLPKAANFTHLRMLFMMTGFVCALGARASDRIYSPLPLYHSTGGVCAVGMAFLPGGALIIKRKFSAREFWSDIHAYRATVFEYIGELCRYLLNQPESPLEKGHSVRVITGNGLRPEIWRQFQDRFAIPRIVEFYGATEGNVSMLNYDGTVGSVGRVPDYLQWRLPTRVVRFDVEKEEAVRGGDGLCIECGADEAGEAVGRLSDHAGGGFEGYSDKKAGEKKILRDVLAKGDAWFRTGDLMRRDRHGYFYFVDRIGDTFRWKGENVATGEVSEALAAVPGIREANVYGVKVPGQDGRAGMAAIVVDGDFSMAALPAFLAARLPAYARPLFLRLSGAITVTGTFKQRKVDLVREGFDPSLVGDPVYWLDPEQGGYERLTPARHGDIVQGRVKL